MFHVLNWSISLKVVKLNPIMGLYATSGCEMALLTLKTYRKNVACCAGSTIGLRSPHWERR